MKQGRENSIITAAIIGGIIIAFILVVGTIWVGQSAKRDTEAAVHSVSLLYLDELAGRREQVVSSNLQRRIDDMRTAVDLMTEEDLSDLEHLQAYQARMKKLYRLDKFAFVDQDGRIYTALGMQDNIDEYQINYQSISEPEISIFNLRSPDKKVVIAIPLNGIPFNGETLTVCFMEIDMDEMLQGVSMESGSEDATFCNLYTADGVSLTNAVLGGLASEDNLLDAMKQAEFEQGYSYEKLTDDFQNGVRSEVSFRYNGILETLSYVPVKGTDWRLTYLIRESVIADKISEISEGTVRRSLIQSALTALVLAGVFLVILSQQRRNARLMLEKETAEAENRVKQQELEQRLTLQENLKDALEAAEQANKAKTIFLSNMSHEIRTPMNAIIGLDTIALNDPDISQKTREYLTGIGDSAEHLLNLINDILDMSRIESGRMILKNEEFSFSKLLEYVNTMISGQCSEKGLDYQCYINGQVDDYYIGDSMKLRQVLINILGNAVKFTPAGGKIDMTVERTAQYDGKSTLKFVISDTGIGMSKEYLPHLFDAFTQEAGSGSNQYGSSGLGLAITKNIVEMMNGNIEVESEKGKGSTFTVVLTLMDSDRQREENDGIELQLHEMTVLIVDDDPVAREHARLVLEKAGIASEIAGSGEEAVRMVQLRHARREPYNLILVDWKMPDMDGVETTRRIREIVGNESAIIILTAYKWDDVLDEAVQAGVDSFIAKPLFATNLLEEFKEAIRRKGAVGTKDAVSVDLSGRRILLAEDVEINAEIMKMVLQMRGMETEVAENGRIAVDLFASHPEGYYSAILMDMRMPEMDGLEATRTIRALHREDAKTIPIIAMTANAFDEDVQRSLQAGLNAHLSKPVKPDALFETLESFIR
ncbi:MAG: response regulator [Candidatus Limivicinus sp.]|jgi:signal transduction histidine kinase/DNA-binding response OmpR family regulator